MNIQEMHAAFRIIGQQNGLQLIRGILDENIDVYINAVISETIHNELIRGVHTPFQENIDTQSSTMSVANLFRTLYRSTALNIKEDIDKDPPSVLETYDKEIGYYKIYMPTVNTNYNGVTGDGYNSDVVKYLINPMMYLGFSVNYEGPEESTKKKFACRLIGADVLENTLRDFCNGATYDNPIVTLLSEHPKDGSDYTNDKTDGDIPQEYIELYTNTKVKTIEKLSIKYIKQPNIVKYDVDISKCVNCDLPEYSHQAIVEQAVYKFYQSIGAISSSNNNRQNNQ